MVRQGLPRRVLVVEPLSRVREAVATFLEVHEDLLLVGSFGSVGEAVPWLAALEPHAVVLDPDLTGAAALALQLQATATVNCVILLSNRRRSPADPVGAKLIWLERTERQADLAALIRRSCRQVGGVYSAGSQ